ncbi:hypothetical protein BS47DRAFT_579686 [Hydnum rufescens UP504]|uniref:Uncharacterized protein n=1 Tax=Hydnum rufescens UP504 TaxID=1448309 RepID=A0A9P6AGT6_9AGAM|nr:hypothetical protein BS47DRAFT_579686 [Hydnum rufescens UP504]
MVNLLSPACIALLCWIFATIWSRYLFSPFECARLLSDRRPLSGSIARAIYPGIVMPRLEVAKNR